MSPACEQAFNEHYKPGAESTSQRRKKALAKIHFAAGWEAAIKAQQNLLEENARG